MLMKNIFDTHAHYTDEAFKDDRNELLSSLKELGICGIINCGTDIPSSIASLNLGDKFDFVYAACGIHPEVADEASEDYLKELKVLTKNPKCVAIGEIGLDYYWRQDNKVKQKKIFREQIELSKELNLPIIVHDRDAHEDTINIIKELQPKGVLHCYSGSGESAKELLKLNDIYFGFGGALTFKNARRAIEAAEIIPLEKILLETDCPYMAPVPMRGKRNYSGYIPYVAEKLAEIKNIDPQEILDITKENAKRLFNIKVTDTP